MAGVANLEFGGSIPSLRSIHITQRLFMKFIIAAILALSFSMAHADGDYSSTSEFRSCAKEFNEVDARYERLQGARDRRDELQSRTDQLDNQIEMARPWATDYNSKMRLNAAIGQFNVMNNELNNYKRSYNSQYDRFKSAQRSFTNSCDMSVDKRSDMWQSVCRDTDDYSKFCSTFN